jgi:hypothetical protein
MIVALVDNGSLEPASTRNLRAVAAALSTNVRRTVFPVSWRHSDRLRAEALDGNPADTLANFVRRHLAQGEREFLFVPFFVSPQGAIGTALRADLERLASAAGGFAFDFTDGLAERGVVAEIVVDRLRETMAARTLTTPAVVVVDHGGPAPVSASLRDRLASEIGTRLGALIGPLAGASMEGGEHRHNRPLLAEVFDRPGFDAGDVVLAPLFLSPGRHAGPGGDLARIAGEAAARRPALRPHFAGLVGNHPAAAAALAAAIRTAIG